VRRPVSEPSARSRLTPPSKTVAVGATDNSSFSISLTSILHYRSRRHPNLLALPEVHAISEDIKSVTKVHTVAHCHFISLISSSQFSNCPPSISPPHVQLTPSRSSRLKITPKLPTQTQKPAHVQGIPCSQPRNRHTTFLRCTGWRSVSRTTISRGLCALRRAPHRSSSSR
jgi:hypothetical protein